MKTKRKWLLGLVILALLVAVGFLVRLRFRGQRPATSSEVNEEYAKFQGTWELLSMEAEGAQKPESEYKKYRMTFKGNVWTVLEGTNVKAETPFDLDPTSNPKTIDLYPSDGRILQGIYALEGDRFSMCDRGTEKGDRPTKFATEPESGLVLVTMRRVKP
jgi:uncharacterized protein (TIGR03067 family)